MSQRGSVLRGGTPFGHPSDENGQGQDPSLRKDQGRSWKTAGALCAPAGLPPAAPILPGQARYPRGVCPPIQHTRGGSTNGGMGVVLHPRRTRAPCQRPASPVSGVRGGCGLGDLGEAVVTPDTLPRRRFAYFAAGGKVSRPAGRNPLEAETVGWKEDPSSVTAYAVTPSPRWGEGFEGASRGRPCAENPALSRQHRTMTSA